MTTGGTHDPHGASAELAELTASETARLGAAGSVSASEVVGQLIARVEAMNLAGPALRCVIEVAPDALDQARALDAERLSGRLRGPLHGVPVLVKDNIDTARPLHTTAGSLVFGSSSPGADAPLVQALRAAGAIILGKANLSEWANFRGRPSSSGWSAAGGQTRNPHALDRTPGGSSAGSGSAVAARLAPLAVGTETDGSILCPSAACGVLGLKPTVGLVSRTGIIPISSSQDTAGPMGRSVEDLALMLEVLARAVDDGEDGAASSVARPPGHEAHYRGLLGDGNLAGRRLGVLREGFTGYHPPTDRVFEDALGALREAGAEILDPVELPNGPLTSGEDEMTVLTHEIRDGLAAYLARRARTSAPDPSNPLPASVAEIVDHIERRPEERADLFGVELLAQAAASGGVAAEAYLEAWQRNRERSRRDGLDRIFEEVDLVVVPAMTPAWLVDHVNGDALVGSGWSPPAVAGYPSATMPTGTVAGLPVGIALWGPAWSEARLLAVMFALERALGRSVTSPVPRFLPSVGDRA
jgi:amidase